MTTVVCLSHVSSPQSDDAAVARRRLALAGGRRLLLRIHRCTQPHVACCNDDHAAPSQPEAAADRLPPRRGDDERDARPRDRVQLARLGRGEHDPEHPQSRCELRPRCDRPRDRVRSRDRPGQGYERATPEKKAAKEPKGPPRWQQFLGRGSARDTFIVGALLTLPGGSYLAGLHRIADQNLSTTATVLSVLAFNLIMLALLEIPTLGYILAPESTPDRVARFKAGLSRHGRRAGIWGATASGCC